MAMKSLQELNREFNEKNAALRTHRADQNIIDVPCITGHYTANEPFRVGQRIADEHYSEQVQLAVNETPRSPAVTFNIILSAAVAILVLVIVAFGAANGTLNKIYGLSCFTVLTGSMQDEIPQGSFILVRQAEPQSLRVGDNITFYNDQDVIVTHKIAGIDENHGGGSRRFNTRGVNNTYPDPGSTGAGDIIGIVVLTIPVLGFVLSYTADKLWIALLLLGLIAMAAMSGKNFFAKNRVKSKKSPVKPRDTGADRMQTRKKKPARRRTAAMDMLSLLLKAGSIAVIFLLLYAFLYGIIHYNEPGMSPTIKAGDLAVYYRYSQAGYAPRDLVALEYNGHMHARRVIATAGDVVDITEDGLLINGALQHEPEILHKTVRYLDGIDFPVTIPEGQVFLLGDDRDAATDSRIYGAVNVGDTLGKVMLIIHHRNI